MQEQRIPLVELRPVPRYQFPGKVDCNSPAHWDGEVMYLFNSIGHPYRAYGPHLFDLGEAQPVTFNNTVNGGRWIEATIKTEEGVLYGWYHFEPLGLCPGTSLTAPQIGALRSEDNGATWIDLGIILSAPEGTLNCSAENGYFAGGHGDFCVVLEEEQKYLYFFFGNYGGEPKEQGIAIARMLWEERDHPVGKVWKWYQGSWSEPGLGGRVTPLFPVFVPWERPDCDAFWGPSIHWNVYLHQYVMLLNRAKGKGWIQEGVYISFSPCVSEPPSWSSPQKIYEGGSWYPQVIGIGEGIRGTDKLAGRVARFFLSGVSDYEILFHLPGE